MKKHYLVAGAAALALASAATVYVASPHHIGPANLYPNASVSPGLVATTDFNELTITTSGCGTYSQCHRQTSQAMKDKVRSEYPGCPSGQGQSEIDHIIPLALGGADDVRNLWCQPAQNDWNGTNMGYHQKDALENELVLQMKAAKITPAAAQQCILSDWVACYQKYVGGQKYGGILAPPVDPDVQ